MPVVHTKDKVHRGTWLYYAPGCSRVTWPLGRSLVALNAADAAQPGAHAPPIVGTIDAQQLQMDAAVPDPDTHSDISVHVAQLQRRERARLALQMRTKILADGTLRGLRDPIWSAPPVGAPPSSGNPAAMFGARPWKRQDASGQPTHPCTVSQRWRNWRAGHMLHCVRCQQATLTL